MIKNIYSFSQNRLLIENQLIKGSTLIKSFLYKSLLKSTITLGKFLGSIHFHSINSG